MKRIFILITLLAFAAAGFAQDAPTMPTGLKQGEQAPAFAGKNQHDETVTLAQALEQGPVVLIFFRGEWCPFCNRHLRELQDKLPMLTEQGASVITVTPDGANGIQLIQDELDADFHIVHDENEKIMTAYGVGFEPPAKYQERLARANIDLAERSGTNGNTLPVPATYVIAQDGTISYVYFNPDYKERVDIELLAQEVAKLKK